MPGLEIANNSDSGRRRKHNEDSTASDLESGIVMVADGMGGYRAGEVASSVAVTSILNFIYRGLDEPEESSNNDTQPDAGHSILLRRAVENANADIYGLAQEHAACRGMGTTVVVAMFHEKGLSVAHVGDSRLYRVRGSEFSQVTRDHSLYQELIDRGLCSPEEALNYTNKSVVTRALGVKQKVEVEVQEEKTEAGDIYLLCSDGLNDMLEDRQMHLTIRKFGDNLEQASTELIKFANARGGRDNISVILARSASGSRGQESESAKQV